jgi:molecular chaperone GrpE
MSEQNNNGEPTNPQAGSGQEHPQQSSPTAQAGASAPAADQGADHNAQNNSGQEEVDPLSKALAEVAILQAKVSELNDQFLRAQADVQNARRRADEEVSKARKFAIESFAESLLPVTDSLEAGLSIKEATIEQIREGSEATLRQLKSALERNKVLEINPAAGAKFDPHQHQAISVVPADQEPNTVVSVLQKGYLIMDRVIRPALITVSGPKAG